MNEILHTELLASLTLTDWILVALAAVVLGLSKAGVGSFSIITVALLAAVFGSKSSTGVLLPMLIIADIFAVYHFRRDCQWHLLFRLLPWMVAGVLLGVWLGNTMDEGLFRKVMSVIIFITVGIMFWREWKKQTTVPSHWSFSGIMGLGAGFTSMVGNLAGGFSNVYFLSMRLPRDQFIGTAAWLFFIINLFKLPFHIFVWKTISTDSFIVDLALVPFLLVGFFLGKNLVQRISEARYRQWILWLTAASTLMVFFK